MSGIFKSIGKVFKKVVKVAVTGVAGLIKPLRKILLPALMVGAVVLTGGAALGALPAIGSVLGSVGISGGLASVLGGAISTGALGAVTGGLGAAISGKNILKGATGGFLSGALTGGVMGAAGMVSPNGILSDMGIGSQAAAKQGLLATGKLSNTTGFVGGNTAGGGVIDNAPTGVLHDVGAGEFSATDLGETLDPIASGGSVTAATAGSGATLTSVPSALGATTTGGGLLGSTGGWIGPALQFGGQVLSGIGQGQAAAATAKNQAQQSRLEYDRAAYNYGVLNTYATNKKGKIPNNALPSSQTMAYNYSPIALANPAPAVSQAPPSGYYQIQNGQVVFVPTGG